MNDNTVQWQRRLQRHLNYESVCREQTHGIFIYNFTSSALSYVVEIAIVVVVQELTRAVATFKVHERKKNNHS